MNGRVKQGLLAVFLGLPVGLGLATAHAGIWPTEARRVEKKLQASSVETRREAARTLPKLSPGLSRPLVRKALSAEDEQVRLAASETVVLHGHQGFGPMVVEWLKDPDPTLRKAALRVIRVSPTAETLDEVGRAMTDSDPAVRVAAAKTLAHAPFAQRTRATRLLLPGLDDEESEVRAATAEALGRAGGEDAAIPVAARLQDPESDVRLKAAVALGSLGVESTSGALVLTLDDRNDQVVAAAAKSLGGLGDESAIAGLAQLLEPQSFGFVQRAAAGALARIGGPRATRLLIAQLSRAHARQTVAELLVSLGPGALPELERCVKDGAPSEVAACGRAYASLNGDPDLLLAATRQGRLAAQTALGLLSARRSREVVVFALELLTEGPREVKRAALQALEDLSPLPRYAAEPILSVLDGPGWLASERARLLGLLAIPGADRVTEVAQLHLDSTDARVRAAAARVLMTAHPAEFVDELLEDPSPRVERAVSEQLAQGMPRELASVFLKRLVRGSTNHRDRLLDSLWGMPRDADEKDIRRLWKVYRGSHGSQRDLLLDLLSRLQGALPHLERVARGGSLHDRLHLAHLVGMGRAPAGLSRILAGDAHPRVRALSLQAIEDPELLVDIATSPSEPAYLRGTALFTLARLPPRVAGKVTESADFDPCSLLEEKAPLVRAAGTLLVASWQTACPTGIYDGLLLDRDPQIRRTAAHALGQHAAGHEQARRALRACRAYEPDPDVFEQCEQALEGGPPHPARKGEKRAVAPGNAPFRFVLLSPLTAETAPLSPLVLRDEQTGILWLGHSDRGGGYRLPRTGDPQAGHERFTLTDPRLSF